MSAIETHRIPRVVIVTNIPAPYRIPIYQRLADKFGYDNFHVVFCSDNEDNREWSVTPEGFAYTVLKRSQLKRKGRYIHLNPDVINVLRRLAPDVVLTTGFNPTHLLAFMYAVLGGKTHIPMTDGTLESEKKLSFLHAAVRRAVFRFSKAFIGASTGGWRLYESYGIDRTHFFQSHLCADNESFSAYLGNVREFDLMFSGRFAPEKNPLFALDVAAGVARTLRRKTSILMLGSGPLLEESRDYAKTLSKHVDAYFPGFVQQAELPGMYCSAKVFLFPSSWDPWGVVANEACAAGQAVIVSPHAGAANDLVRHGENGYVLDIQLSEWVPHVAGLLSDAALLEDFSKRSQFNVQAYNYHAAADGIIDAVLSANGKNSSKLAVRKAF